MKWELEQIRAPLTLVGHGLAATPAEVRRSAYTSRPGHTQTRGHTLSPAHRNSSYPGLSLSPYFLYLRPASFGMAKPVP